MFIVGGICPHQHNKNRIGDRAVPLALTSIGAARGILIPGTDGICVH